MAPVRKRTAGIVALGVGCAVALFVVCLRRWTILRWPGRWTGTISSPTSSSPGRSARLDRSPVGRPVNGREPEIIHLAPEGQRVQGGRSDRASEDLRSGSRPATGGGPRSRYRTRERHDVVRLPVHALFERDGLAGSTCYTAGGSRPARSRLGNRTSGSSRCWRALRKMMLKRRPGRHGDREWNRPARFGRPQWHPCSPPPVTCASRPQGNSRGGVRR